MNKVDVSGRQDMIRLVYAERLILLIAIVVELDWIVLHDSVRGSAYLLGSTLVRIHIKSHPT